MGLDPHLVYACLHRDGFRCRHCNSSGPLHPHHVIFKSHGGEDALNNLLTLCAQCHIEGVHRRKLRIETLELLENDLRVKFIRVDGWKPQ